MKPLANECFIDMSNLEPQLAVAQNLVSQQHIERFYFLLSSIQTAFLTSLLLFVCFDYTRQ